MKMSYAAAAVLAVSAGAWLLSGHLSGGQATLEARKPPADLSASELSPLVRVRVQQARPRAIQLVLRGRTEAQRDVQVKAETYGRVIELNIERGSRVAAGDVLARLDPADRPARLAEAKALLGQRKIEHTAAARLSKKGFRAETQLAASKAALEAAEAAVKRALVALDDTVIRAPFDGLIDDHMAEIGDYLDTGDPLARAVDLDPILVVAQVNERDVGQLSPGGTARARLVTGRQLEGSIRFISSVADAATRTFRVEVEVANPDGAVLDGISAELHLPLGRRQAHLVSPAILTLTDRGVVGVMLLEAGDSARFHPVEIIDQTPEGLWLGGLPERITVITVGQEFVTDGQRVRSVDEADLDARENRDDVASPDDGAKPDHGALPDAES